MLAICKVSEDVGGDPLCGSDLDKFCLKNFGTNSPGIVIYNDTHTHEEVLALFDKAIANG